MNLPHSNGNPLGEIQKLLKWVVAVFVIIAGIMVIAGVIMVFDDPAGFILMGFGLVFGGLPLFVYSKMRPPPGKRAVVMEARQHSQPGVRHRTAALQWVDEEAVAEDDDEIRRRWLLAKWHEREDWVSGCLQGEDERRRETFGVIIIAWTVFTIILLALGWFFDGFFFFAAFVVGTVTAIMVVLRLRLSRHLGKFGASQFLMDPCPVPLGGRLHGRVLTGIPVQMGATRSFEVGLKCIYRYQATEQDTVMDRPSEVEKQSVKWEKVVTLGGRSSGKRLGSLEVPIDLALPSDLPATSLSSSSLVWELHVTSAMRGLDYRVRFRIPVFEPSTIDSLFG